MEIRDYQRIWGTQRKTKKNTTAIQIQKSSTLFSEDNHFEFYNDLELFNLIFAQS